MIHDLMDNRYLKRFILLEHLHINQNHPIELMELVKLSHVSYPTVKKSLLISSWILSIWGTVIKWS